MIKKVWYLYMAIILTLLYDFASVLSHLSSLLHSASFSFQGAVCFACDEKDQTIETLTARLSSYENDHRASAARLQEQNMVITELHNVLENRDKELVDQGEIISGLNAALAERDAALAQTDATIADKDVALEHERTSLATARRENESTYARKVIFCTAEKRLLLKHHTRNTPASISSDQCSL